jgi:hypothetical protein
MLCLLLFLAVYALAEPLGHRCLAHSTIANHDHFDFTLQMCMQYTSMQSQHGSQQLAIPQ